MIPTISSVQKGCIKARSMLGPTGYRGYTAQKRAANRSHRRAFTKITQRFINDPDSFDDETFIVPSLSAWDVS